MICGSSVAVFMSASLGFDKTYRRENDFEKFILIGSNQESVLL